MTALEEYDGRITHILSKAEAIRNKRFRISVGTCPPVWKPPDNPAIMGRKMGWISRVGQADRDGESGS